MIAGVGERRLTPLIASAALLGVGLLLQLNSNACGGKRCGDIGSLYGSRGIRPHALPYLDRALEYPVVVGYVMWATSWLASSANTFVIANGALLAPLGLLTVALLQRRDPSRVLRFASAPMLALYGFHNWDLVPVFCTVAGLVAIVKRHGGVGGALLAAGAWTKLYPGLFVIVLVPLLWRKDRELSTRLLAGTAVTSAVLNGPVLASSWSGWWHAIEFQGERQATWGSLWFHLFRLPGVNDLVVAGPGLANALSGLTLLAGLTWVGWRFRQGTPDPVAVAAVVTVVFVLANKVYSPQYSLWVLPFFVLLPISRRLWLAFMAADLAMYVLVFGHISPDTIPRGTLVALIGTAAALRAVILVGIARAALPSAPARSTMPSPTSTREPSFLSSRSLVGGGDQV